MKLTKILAIILSCCMLVCAFASCGSDDSGDSTTTPADGEGDAADVKLTVTIKVLDADENVVYETENYSYSGKAPNLIDLIEDYLDMEHETVADYDEYGTLSAIGSVEAGEVTSHDDNTNEDVTLYTSFWWYRVNGKDGTDMMEEYAVKDGDVIEYYLSKKK